MGLNSEDLSAKEERPLRGLTSKRPSSGLAKRPWSLTEKFRYTGVLGDHRLAGLFLLLALSSWLFFFFIGAAFRTLAESQRSPLNRDVATGHSVTIPDPLILDDLAELLKEGLPVGNFPKNPRSYLEEIVDNRSHPSLFFIESRFVEESSDTCLSELRRLCAREQLFCLSVLQDGTFDSAMMRNSSRMNYSRIPHVMVDGLQLLDILEHRVAERSGGSISIQNGETLALLFGMDGQLAWLGLNLLSDKPSPCRDLSDAALASIDDDTLANIERESSSIERESSSRLSFISESKPAESPSAAGTTTALESLVHSPQGENSLGPRLALLKHPIFDVKRRKKTSLSFWVSQQDKPVLINFWATWCIPCREEMPRLQELALQYSSVLFVGMARDNVHEDSYRKIQDLLDEFGLTFPQYIVPNSELQREIVGQIEIPAFAYFNREGVLTATIGSILEPENEDLLIKLLNKPRGSDNNSD